MRHMLYIEPKNHKDLVSITWGTEFPSSGGVLTVTLIGQARVQQREWEICLEKKAYLSVSDTSATPIHQIKHFNKGSRTSSITAAGR